MEKISVIIPCYNSEHSIEQVVNGIRDALKGQFDYQIILSNDCSSDNVWQQIRKLCAGDERIVGLSLSRNFGQQAAYMAATHYVTGEYVVFMDDDGQHPPEGILQLMEKIREGYDIVYAEFLERKASRLHRWGSIVNEKMSEYLVGKPKGVGVSSFQVVRRFVIEALKEYKSPTPYPLGYCMSITRNIACVPMKQRERIQGKSGYVLSKMLRLWMNGFTSFSVVPLRIADVLGLAFTVVGFLAGAVIAARKFLNPQIPAGYTSLIVVILICSGMIMLMLGLIGEYVGRMFLAINRLPQYVVREMVNVDKNDENQIIGGDVHVR